MNVSLAGKVAVVAGGTGGLGRAVSRLFLSEGAKTVVTYRNEEEFSALKQDAGSALSLLEGVRLDVTDEDAVSRFVSDMVGRNGRIDCVVNTVGGYAAGQTLWELDRATLDRMLALNLRAGYALAHAAVVPMLQQKNGSLVNVAAKAAFDHGAGAAAYAASKAAAVAMIDSLAADLRGTGVRANSVLPSIIDTLPNRNAMPNADFSTWPKPEDIARVILFLSSDASQVIHGAAIPVYGSC